MSGWRRGAGWVWLAAPIALLAIAYAAISAPFSAMRRTSYATLSGYRRDHGGADGLVTLVLVALTIWLSYLYWPEAREMIGGGQARRPPADHEDALARRLAQARVAPSLLDRGVAEEPLDRVYADRAVEMPAIAAVLARMIADPPMHRRQRVVGDEGPPRFLEAPALRQAEPGLNVLAGGTGMIARRQQVVVHRPPAPHRPVVWLVTQIGELREVRWRFAHGCGAPARASTR